MLVISDGVLSLTKPRCWATTPTRPSGRPGWTTCSCRRIAEWALNVVVVRSGGQTILIDAGIGPDPDFDLPRAGRINPETGGRRHRSRIRDRRVLTHMHMDHIGGLLIDGVKEQLRPDLRIHVEAAEVEFWKSPDFSRVSIPARPARIWRRPDG